MARVALVGIVGALAEVVSAALAEDGHTVTRLALDADVVRNLNRSPPDVVVFDGHAYANTKAFLTDLRAQPETATLPVVVLGPERPAEVPNFQVVYQLGRTLDLPQLLGAVSRAVHPTTG
jgi:DNA-binding response OmpR family regulator